MLAKQALLCRAVSPTLSRNLPWGISNEYKVLRCTGRDACRGFIRARFGSRARLRRLLYGKRFTIEDVFYAAFRNSKARNGRH